MNRNQAKFEHAPTSGLEGVVNAALHELPSQITAHDIEQVRKAFDFSVTIVQYGAGLLRKLGVDETVIADALRGGGLAELE